MENELTRDDADVRTFVNQLIAHAANVYSLCSFFLAVLALLPIWFGLNLLWLSAAAAVFSLLPASYRTWREALEKLPARARLLVTCKTSVVDLPIENRVPETTGKLDIRLTISNPTDEPAFLVGVELVSWEASPGVIDGPLSVKLYGKREQAGFGELQYPVKIESKARREDIALFAGIRAAPIDDAAFAKGLMQSEAIAISFRILTENAAHIRHSCVVEDQAPLNVYKESALRTWESKGHSDLLGGSACTTERGPTTAGRARPEGGAPLPPDYQTGAPSPARGSNPAT
jgi:hypothetical protein